MKKRAIVISAILLLMLFIGAFFLYRNYLPKTKEGEKSITVTVVHGVHLTIKVCSFRARLL